uniref:NADH-ubiquinone oxidoreductase chain 3 n=1 Tax=Lyperosomum longicauda TaxID=2714089 RepID=A0A6H0YBT0_9TREM|nr:NADH dehydrogenase subunit 3 [Lyperosomum longicauda]QIX04656.1 NADH dehydrogenase subunit 3 [Lyperosomum longicauda]
MVWGVSVFLFFFFFFSLLSVYYSFLWLGGCAEMSGVRAWVSSFECGFAPGRIVENYFSGTYFSLLVFFVVFDLEISLLLNFPLQGVAYDNLVFYLLFLVSVSIAFGVEIVSGYVD